MDDNEFEFPPDQLDDVVASRLSPYHTAMPSPPGTSLEYQISTLPLSMLAQIPLEQLPPTVPKNPQNFSIGQVLRGALSTSHMRPPPGSGDTSRPGASVAPLPYSQRLQQHNSPYLAGAHPPPLLPPLASSDEEERAGGAENAYDVGEGGGEGVPNGNPRSSADLDLRVHRVPNRQARIDWSEGEVRSFYQALSQYGTDFSAIAVLFPGRSRKDIKRLYQRELRQKPKDVQTALSQKNPIDMATFEVRYEAKKKETQQPLKTKKLNSEELAFLNEIAGEQSSDASGLVIGEEFEAPAPAATLGAVEETTAAPLSRPRKRHASVQRVDGQYEADVKREAKEITSTADNEFDMEHESLDNFFAAVPQHGQQHQSALEHSDFAFE